MFIYFLSFILFCNVHLHLVFHRCRDEWLGIDGMVTQKNPDENVNHLPSATSCIDGNSNEESLNNSKRFL